MNRLKELLKYHFKIYIKSNKFIMPLLVWGICMYTFYSTVPVSIVSSFVMSMVSLFFLMAWIGLAYTEIDNPVSEQLLILKVGSENIYNISKILFLVLIGIAMSFIGVMFPVIQNIINKHHLYTRDITIVDVVVAFLLHSFVSVLGATTGTLLHPRIKKDRKMAVIMTFAIALMSIVKGGLNIKIPITRFITWIFPPLYEITECFTGKEYYLVNDVSMAILYASVYSIILILLQLYLLKRNKF